MSETAAPVTTAPAQGTPAQGTEIHQDTPPKPQGQPVPKPAPKIEAAAEPKKYKVLKHNGQEVEVDEDTYTRFAQKAFAADRELSEAKRLKREAEERAAHVRQWQAQIEAMKKEAPSKRVKMLLEELQDNPDAVKEFRGTVEQWLYDKLQEESASPEMQRAMKAERELERIKKQQAQEAEKAKKEAWEKEVAASRPAQEKLIIEALTMSGLPKTEWNVKHAADIIYNARVKGHKVTNEQVASILKEDRIDNVRALGSEFSSKIIEAHTNKDFDTVLKAGEQLAELYGEDILKALRIYDLRKHLSSKPEMPKPVVETQKTEGAQKKGAYEYKNMDEWTEARKRIVQSMSK